MNVKLPWWFFLTLTLALLGGSLYAGYYMGTRGSDDTIQNIREQAAVDSVVWDSVRTALNDSVDFYRDSITGIEGKIDTVRIRVPVAVDAARTAGANLQEHLEAQGDTAGLRLYHGEEAADSVVLALRVSEVNLLSAEVGALRDQVRVQGLIITEQDSMLVRLRANLALALDEADRQYRIANPPFTVKLWRDGWKFAVGAAGGYLIGKA
jgi:hypothetical protein